MKVRAEEYERVGTGLLQNWKTPDPSSIDKSVAEIVNLKICT